MANLKTITVNTKEYKSLETLTSLTFTNDTVYTIQVLGTAFIREGEEGDGQLIDRPIWIQYTHRGNTLYIGQTSGDVRVNVAD